MSSAFNFTTGRTIYTFPQLQNDVSASNFSVNCDPRSVGPINSSINSSSRAGKLAVETDICDLTISGDLTVNGLIFAKFSAIAPLTCLSIINFFKSLCLYAPPLLIHFFLNILLLYLNLQHYL